MIKKTEQQLFIEMKIDLGFDKYSPPPYWIQELIETLISCGWVKK